MKPDAIRVCAIDHTRYEVAEQIWYLQHASYRAEIASIGWNSAPPLMVTVRQIQTCGETFVGGVCDGELRGAASWRPADDGSVLICRMMVHPDHLRRGIGSALLSHILQREPASRFVVHAGAGNTPAVRLYEKFGFSVESEEEVPPGIRLLRMTLNRS